MARVSGPLMSLDASGKFAGVMVASIWKGRNYMRQYVIPTNPNTTAQQAQRALLAAAVAAWKLIPAEDGDITSDSLQTSKEDWNTAARDVSPPISGANYFVMQWIKQSSESGWVAADGPSVPAVAPQRSDAIHGR